MTSVVPRAHNRGPFWLHLSHPISELYSVFWCPTRCGKLSSAGRGRGLLTSVSVAGGGCYQVRVLKNRAGGWLYVGGGGPYFGSISCLRHRNAYLLTESLACAQAQVPIFFSKQSSASSSRVIHALPSDPWTCSFNVISILLSCPSLSNSSHFVHPFSIHEPQWKHASGTL